MHGLTTWEAFTLVLLPMFSILALLVIVLIVVIMVAASSNDSGSNNNNKNSDDKSSGGDANQNYNGNTDAYRRRNHRYRNDDWWWGWGGSRSTNNNVNQSPQYVHSGIDQNPRLKRQWFCLACQYRRWVRQGPTTLTCLRCDGPMQATDAVR